jgi:hypothetical protein
LWRAGEQQAAQAGNCVEELENAKQGLAEMHSLLQQ